MSEILTDRQRQVLECIRQHLQDTGMAPTRAEIADLMGFQSKNAASDHLRALERKGFIRIHNDRSRGIQLLDAANWNDDEMPLVGRVAAGLPIEAVENVERTVPVPQGLFNQRRRQRHRWHPRRRPDCGTQDQYGTLRANRGRSP